MSEKNNLKQQLEDIHKKIEDISNELKEPKILVVELTEIQKGFTRIYIKEGLKESQETEEKRSFALLYFSIFLSALVGIIGNFFVSLWFEEAIFSVRIGLIVSGTILVFICVVLWIEYWKFR